MNQNDTTRHGNKGIKRHSTGNDTTEKSEQEQLNKGNKTSTTRQKHNATARRWVGVPKQCWRVHVCSAVRPVVLIDPLYIRVHA